MFCFNQQTMKENTGARPLNYRVSSVAMPMLSVALIVFGSLLTGIAQAEQQQYKNANLKGSMHGRNKTLAAIRQATLPYVDVRNALDAGYVSTVDLGAGCISAAGEGEPSQLGAMGIHFVKLSQVGAPDFDFSAPGVLVYAPDPAVAHCSYTTDELLDSNPDCAQSLRLVAVEELVFAHLWQATITEPHWQQPPEFLGNQFYYVHDNPETFWVDEAHGFPPHYELHIWLYDHNPAGLFAAWNPTISCPAYLQGH
jgi:hypothetical protein